MSMHRTPTARLLAGLSFIALAGHGTAALAADECGVTLTGAVVCTSAGNPYAGGITYVAPGDVSITTNADVVSQGTVSATSIAGAGTVISNGQIATAAEATTGISVIAPGNVAITSAAVTTSSPDSAGIFAQSGGTIAIDSNSVAVTANGGAGILALGQGAVTITSGAASALNESAIFARSQSDAVALTLTGANTSATSDAITAISGSTVSVTVAAGGSAVGQNALALSPLTASTVTNAGTLTGTDGYAIIAKFGTTTVINSGTINSGVEFTAKGGSLTNSGTFNATQDSMFGGGTITNSGTVQVTAAAPAAGVTFYGLGSFANSGTLSLANGRAGDGLNLPGTFTGTGGSTLVLDTATGSVADHLTIGGAATGVTSVKFVNNGDAGLLNPGTVIVTAGAGSTADAFQIAPASVSAGFVRSGITFNSAANSYSLVTTPATAAYRPLVYAEGARNIWYKVSEVWEAHTRALRDGTDGGGRLWGQFYGSADTRHDAISSTVFGQTANEDLSYRQDAFGAQLGLDLSPQSSTAVTFGITGGYVNSDLNFLGQNSRVRDNVVNLGGYTSLHAGGVFVNLFGQYAHYWIKATDSAIGFDQSLHGSTYGGTGEAGFRFGDAGFFIEPLATLSYVRTHLDNFTALSSSFDFHDSDGLRGKLGARFGTSKDFSGGKLTFYGGGNAVKAFRGRDSLLFTNNGVTLAFTDQKIPLYGEGYAGLSIASPGGVSGFFEGFGDYGQRDTQRGGGLRAGLRIAL